MKPLVRVALGLILPAVIVGGYALYTSLVRDPFFPSVDRIAERFRELWLFDRVLSDVVPSLSNLFVGYAIACLAGLTVGLALGRVRLLRETFLPFLQFARSIPPLMLIPPLVLILGLGDTSKIVIIALGAFFPVLVATVDGVVQTDAELVDMAHSIRLGWLATLRRVWIPSALPSVLGGAQTALQLALVLMVASEMAASLRGLGFITIQAQMTFNAPTVWAGVVLLSLIGVVLNALFGILRRRLLRWHSTDPA